MTTDYIPGIHWVLVNYIPPVSAGYQRDWAYAKSIGSRVDWMEIVPPVAIPRKKQPRDPYREQKQARHVTRGGKGVVARLRKEAT